MPHDPAAFARITAASGPAFSRDGERLFYLRGAGLQQIWMLDLVSGEHTQVTHHDEKVAMIRRAPQDDRIIHGIDAGGDERQQLWLIDADTEGTPPMAPLTQAPDVIHDFGGWSPDGTHIAYAANDRDEACLDVIVQKLGETAKQRIFQGTGEVKSAGWSPDGRRLAVIENKRFEEDVVHLLDVVGGARHTVATTRPTRFEQVRWASDGNGFLCLTDAEDRDFLALCRVDADDRISVLHEAPGRDVEAYAISADRTLLATIENDGGRAVLRVGPTGTDRPVVDGIPSHVADIALSADGTRLAFSASSTTEPPGLFLWERETGAVRSLWQPNVRADADLDPARFAPFELIGWTSFDGRRIPGWIARPRGKMPAGGWPAVIWVHGGPAGQTRTNFRPDMQMLLDQGYAVMMPNVRGSTGYGRASTLSDEREKRLDTVEDLAHGRRWLAEQPDIDADRIAVMGQSYGGYMVLGAITEHPELWRAAIDFYGIADFRTLLLNTGPWRQSHRAAEYGAVDDAALFDGISPIHKADRITAPLLVLHGDRDPRVPYNESEQIVTALEQRQQKVQFESFTYAGHGFIRPDHKPRAYTAVAAFLERHLGVGR